MIIMVRSVSQSAHLSLFICAAALTFNSACGETPTRKSGPGNNSGGSDAGPADANANSDMDAGAVSMDASGGNSSSCNPQRLIFLGDSIPGCTGVGGKEGPQCGPKVFHQHMKDNYNRDVTYENISVPGAVTEDVVRSQMSNATPGSESMLVVIYAGGNDLQPYIFASDDRANDAFTQLEPEIEGYWREIFEHFNDKTKYSGDVKLIINQQFNPFDDCTTGPFNVTQRKSELLRLFNQIIADLADEQDNVHVVDQHTPFLGHGHHYRTASCPFYESGNEYWMVGGLDLVHPNGRGHASIANVWSNKADELYENCP